MNWITATMSSSGVTLTRGSVERDIPWNKLLLRYVCGKCGGSITYGCSTQAGHQGKYFCYCEKCNAEEFISKSELCGQEEDEQEVWDGLPEDFKQAVLRLEEEKNAS